MHSFKHCKGEQAGLAIKLQVYLLKIIFWQIFLKKLTPPTLLE